MQYKESTKTEFTTVTHSGTTTTATITPLEPGTSYDVRVQATTNNDGDSPWSLVGTGSTNKVGNSPPQSNEDTLDERGGGDAEGP